MSITSRRVLSAFGPLLTVLCLSPTVSAQTPPPSTEMVLRPGVVVSPPRYVDRSMTLAPNVGLMLYGGSLGMATLSGDDTGVGFTFNGGVGLFRRFEAEVGSGLRLGQVVSDRFARVGREEIYQVGTDFVSNPYFRVRYGILDGAARRVMVGAELRGVIPVSARTVFSFGAGVPVHARWGAVRVESGLFVQWMPSEAATVRNVTNIPLRVWFAIGARVTAGLLLDFAWSNVWSSASGEARVSVAAAVRGEISPTFAVMGQLVLPAVEPFGTDSRGLAVSFESRL